MTICTSPFMKLTANGSFQLPGDFQGFGRSTLSQGVLYRRLQATDLIHGKCEKTETAAPSDYHSSECKPLDGMSSMKADIATLGLSMPYA